MFIQIIIAILLGICLGVFTGLTPGIHINLLAAIIFSVMPYIRQDPIIVAVAVFSMAIVHTFIDIVPSVYLGAPDEAMALNALPAHRLLLQGDGHYAVLTSLLGSFTSLMFTIALFSLLIYIIKAVYMINYLFKYLIIAIVIIMILSEKRKADAVAIFLLSGVLGYIALRTSSQPFYHLFTGFFGISMLLQSGAFIPPQQIGGEIVKVIPRLNLFSFLSGVITGIFPGTTNSTSAIFFNVKEDYLYYVSGINTSSMIISLGTYFAIEKARNGIIITLSNILSDIPLLLFISISIIAGSTAMIIGISLSKKIISLLKRINYSIMKVFIILFLVIISLYFDGAYGIIILLISTSIGIVSKVKRSFMLGCILFPLLIFYFV